MKKILFQTPMACLAALLLCACSPRSAAPAGVDPVIADALASVEIDSVRSYIDDLVGLHTRHTLSTLTDP